VGKVTLRACAHQDYLRRRGVPRQPNDLLAHDLIGGDRNDDTLKGFAAQGLVVGREQFAFRADDLIVVWQAVRAGLGVGFVSEHLIRSDPAVIPVLPKLKIEPLPVWLAVHKEIRTSKRIRAVYDFLADALPRAI
jgi:DNA-binding transcriptional LysR family regulator